MFNKFLKIFLFLKDEKIDMFIVSLPLIWIYLIGNTLTQYVCISSVFVLTTECTSLTVTLVLTLRKFTSLIISIIYFQNPFTLTHWIGTMLVFVGTLMFTKKLIKTKINKFLNFLILFYFFEIFGDYFSKKNYFYLLKIYFT